MAKQVITWSSPNGAQINLCHKCEHEIIRGEDWPKDHAGRELCQVYRGQHRGTCDRCEVRR